MTVHLLEAGVDQPRRNDLGRFFCAWKEMRGPDRFLSDGRTAFVQSVLCTVIPPSSTYDQMEQVAPIVPDDRQRRRP